MTRKIVATYDYQDEQGKLLYQVVRYDPKGFSQRRPAIDPKPGTEPWVWNLGETRRVLYKLPELLKADPRLPVLVVEGERDVETLMAMGIVATCNAGGAGKWLDEYCEPLKGRKVVVLPDNDAPGVDHALAVVHKLAPHVASLRYCLLLGLADKGDVTDWIAAGHSKKDLYEFAASCPDIKELAAKVGNAELLSAAGPQEAETEPEQPGVPDPENDAPAEPAEHIVIEDIPEGDWRIRAVHEASERISSAAERLSPYEWLVYSRRQLQWVEHQLGATLEQGS